MVSKKKINGWAAVALVFLVCAVVYGLLSSYPRELAVYSDELRYLDVARSLLQGRGLRVRNMPSDYEKILYPLCMLPALLLRTTAAQSTAIGWLNAVYMASAVFPAYALARAMRLTPRRTAFVVGVTAVLPTMSAAATFMSETVFLPLSLWEVYFFLRAMLAAPRARVGWCAEAGAFCYLLYLNKEVALYYLLAWVLVRGWVWWHDKAGWRAELACNAALLGSFLACFVLAKVTLFRGLGNSYNQTGWLTGEQWRFLPFALVCDALFTVLAFWVYPVLLPLCGLHGTGTEHSVGDLAAGQVGQLGRAGQQLLQGLLALTDADAQLSAGIFLLDSLGALLGGGAAGVALGVKLLGVGCVQDVVDQQMEAVRYVAQLLRRIRLVQGNQFGVVFQLPQQVIAHGIVTGQIQRCTAAEIGLIVKILCPRLGLGRMVKVVVVRLPQVQEKERVRSIHCVFALPRKHTAEAAVDLIRKQLGAAAALCNIAVILF